MAIESEAKNLEAISKAIDRHNENCEFDLVKILMNPFEADRLGWEDIRGYPVEPDSSIGTGRFRLVCAGEEKFDKLTDDEAVEDAVSEIPEKKELISA